MKARTNCISRGFWIERDGLLHFWDWKNLMECRRVEEEERARGEREGEIRIGDEGLVDCCPASRMYNIM